MLTFSVIILAMSALVQCQRGSFAGTRPIGFPEVVKPTTTADPLGNRFGEGDVTTERLPLEANGDRDLVDRISKWPIDKQPFWYINWKALEAQRKNPQTYPQRPSQFAQQPNFNAANSNTGSPNTNTVTGTQNSNTGSASTATNSNAGVQNSEVPSLGNRNGVVDTTSNTGNTKQMKTAAHYTPGFGHYPHNRYGT